MTDTTRRHAEGVDPPAPILPEDSVLSRAEYLSMQEQLGDPTRFELLRTLSEHGPLGATELRETLELRGNRLHYHLDRLVDVGLVENRKESSPDRDGLYSYYRLSALGEGILEHGVVELMRREREFRDEYR
ncbi:ArsR/SmtB family transcription factor [Halostella salina]|uniref:ArsR/SmtB family transcription factor n=1 Tax=Halostella salina TaxID=1547897 RepID=UPI000EF7E5DE|nr:helix-turn-helix domain-containing protein [Halostella salina]